MCWGWGAGWMPSEASSDSGRGGCWQRGPLLQGLVLDWGCGICTCSRQVTRSYKSDKTWRKFVPAQQVSTEYTKPRCGAQRWLQPRILLPALGLAERFRAFLWIRLELRLQQLHPRQS